MGLTQTVEPVQTKTIARHSFKEKRLKSHKYLWNMFKWTTSVSYLCMRPETVMFERWLRGGRKGTFCTLNHATFSLFIYPVGLLIQILLFFFHYYYFWKDHRQTQEKFPLHYSCPFSRNSLCFSSAPFWLHFKGSEKYKKNMSKTKMTSHRFTSKESVIEKINIRREVTFICMMNSMHSTFLYLNLKSFEKQNQKPTKKWQEL